MAFTVGRELLTAPKLAVPVLPALHHQFLETAALSSSSFPSAPALQVVDLISLKPFDMETISKSIKKTRKVS